MDVQEGDAVLVNLAPFIGSSHRSKVRIPCRVLAVDAIHVEVRTEYPFREVYLRVLRGWIEGKLESDRREGGARYRVQPSFADEVHRAEVGAVG